MTANAVPAFTNAPVIGAGVTSLTADTGYGGTGGTAPTTAVTVTSGSTNGRKVKEIVIVPTGTVVACNVNLFLYDGTTYWLFDQATFGATTLAQATAQSRWSKQYPNLVIPTGWSLRATVTVTQTANLFVVTAFGGDF